MLDPATPPKQIVTSSELVRHFGYWQDRAARTPVYILHRGRPRLVLTSVEIMDALCAPHSVGIGCGPDLAAVLERVEDRVVIANDRQQIIAASATARHHFGAVAEDGRALVRIAPEEAQPHLAAALDRVARTGLSVTLELPSRGVTGDAMIVLVDPWPGGLMMIARDAPRDPDTTDRAAFDAAMAASAAIAPARIDLRGRLEAGQSALATWCNLRSEAMAGVAFASLFDAGSQYDVRDAFERVSRTGQSLQTNALLLANLAEPLAVRIGMAPRRTGRNVSGIAAVLVARSG